MRNPSTPRSSQNRSVSAMASRTAGVVPVEVGLLGREAVVVPGAGHGVPRPGRAGRERGLPVGGRVVGRALVPQVPGPLGAAGRRRPRGQEPGVLVAGVVGHPVEQHPQAPVVGLADQGVDRGQRAEQRVDVAVVAHVVAVVGHRRREDRRQPQGVDAQPGQVVEVAAHAVEVADPVAGGVAERPRVDLVDDRLPPPAGRGAGVGRSLDRAGGAGLEPKQHEVGVGAAHGLSGGPEPAMTSALPWSISVATHIDAVISAGMM